MGILPLVSVSMLSQFPDLLAPSRWFMGLHADEIDRLACWNAQSLA